MYKGVYGTFTCMNKVKNTIKQNDWLIVGLGNPGERYRDTRHNAGKMAVEKFEQDLQEYSHIISGNKVKVLFPDTYMNLSGGPVSEALGKNKQERKKHAHKLIVVHDDIDLPFGAVKISYGKGSGGQKGVEDIIKSLGTKEFARVRIGIVPVFFGKMRKPQGARAVSAFVLKRFGILEKRELPKILERVSYALTEIIKYGVQKAMNSVN